MLGGSPRGGDGTAVGFQKEFKKNRQFEGCCLWEGISGRRVRAKQPTPSNRLLDVTIPLNCLENVFVFGHPDGFTEDNPCLVRTRVRCFARASVRMRV